MKSLPPYTVVQVDPATSFYGDAALVLSSSMPHLPVEALLECQDLQWLLLHEGRSDQRTSQHFRVTDKACALPVFLPVCGPTLGPD